MQKFLQNIYEQCVNLFENLALEIVELDWIDAL